MYGEGVTHFISILFKYPFGRGGGVQGFFFVAILEKEIFILFFPHDDSIFFYTR